MNSEQLEKLIAKYIAGQASAEEIQTLDEWYGSFDSQEDLYQPFSSYERALVTINFSKLIQSLKLANSA